MDLPHISSISVVLYLTMANVLCLCMFWSWLVGIGVSPCISKSPSLHLARSLNVPLSPSQRAGSPTPALLPPRLTLPLPMAIWSRKMCLQNSLSHRSNRTDESKTGEREREGGGGKRWVWGEGCIGLWFKNSQFFYGMWMFVHVFFGNTIYLGTKQIFEIQFNKPIFLMQYWCLISNAIASDNLTSWYNENSLLILHLLASDLHATFQ